MSRHISEHSFLFTGEERELIYRSSSEMDTRPVSFVTRVFLPLWRFLSRTFVSDQVAPNAITLVGVLCSMQAYQVIHSYYNHSPSGSGLGPSHEVLASLSQFGMRGAGGGANAHTNTTAVLEDMYYASIWECQRTVRTATVVAALLLIVAIVCGSLDGVHAKRCRSATSLGDIFSRICSSVSRIFMALTLLEVFQVNTIATKWYVLLTMQLIELNTVLGRINANNLKKEKVKNWAYLATYCFRDSELSFVMLLLLLLRWLCPTYTGHVMQQIDIQAARRGYELLVLLSFVNIAALKMRKRNKTAIIFCLATRVVPVFYLLPLSEYNILSVLSDALVVALLSVEVYVSHLAHRRVHAAVTCIIVGSLFNDVAALAGSAMYLTAVLVDLSYVLNVPLFVPVCNVYIDGVFDLCHAGHKLMMANALRFGNRLIVGVCGDDECESYKRRPIMTTDERVKEVALCRYVSEVVPNAPVSGITEEMIKYYNVHIVVCGEEYNTPQDTYYAVPRRLGMLRTAPRTEGISTSELIKRIRAASDEDTVAKDKLSGKSTVKDGS